MKNIYDFSTLDASRLSALPAHKKPPTYHYQTDPGNGCYGDPPGYPSYFTRAVYTQYGNSARSGAQYVIEDSGGVFRVVGMVGEDWEKKAARLWRLWAPLPEDNPRVRMWVERTYQHFAHCYNDEGATEKDKTLIYPVPYYKLETFTDDPRFSDERREKERAAIAQKNQEIIAHAEKVALLENHQAVRMIRKFYPAHAARLDLIAVPPQRFQEDWWEREAQRPTAEECKARITPGHLRHVAPRCRYCGRNVR